MRRRRILFVHEDPRRMGGGERVLLETAQLAKEVADVHLALVFGDPSTLAPELRAMFAEITCFAFPLELRVRALRQFIASLRALRAFMHELEPCAVIAWSYPAAFRMALVTPSTVQHRLWRCNLAVDDRPKPRRGRRSLALRLMASANITVLCPTSFIGDHLALLGYPPQQLEIVPHPTNLHPIALDAPAKRSFRQQHAVPQADLVIACIARVDPLKNHSLLLRAVARCRDRGVRVALLCVGGVDSADVAYAASLRDLAAQLRIAELVCWVGHRDDVALWLSAADAAALVSHTEAGALSLLEAAAAGLAILATDIGALRDFVVPGESGFLFASNDVEGCAEAMIALARDEQQRLRLGAGARQRLRDTIDPDQINDTWRRIFAAMVRVAPRA